MYIGPEEPLGKREGPQEHNSSQGHRARPSRGSRGMSVSVHCQTCECLSACVFEDPRAPQGSLGPGVPHAPCPPHPPEAHEDPEDPERRRACGVFVVLALLYIHTIHMRRVNTPACLRKYIMASADLWRPLGAPRVDFPLARGPEGLEHLSGGGRRSMGGFCKQSQAKPSQAKQRPTTHSKAKPRGSNT